MNAQSEKIMRDISRLQSALNAVRADGLELARTGTIGAGIHVNGTEKYNGELLDRDCITAMVAIERMIPKDPAEREDMVTWCGKYRCPDCDMQVSYGSGDGFNFCPECGRQIKWPVNFPE